MCSRGVFQLQKLSLFFCDFGGSSNGVRNFLTSDSLKQFMKAQQHIQFKFILKRNHHPFVAAAFLNGYIKQISLRSESQNEVLSRYEQLTREIGRAALPPSGVRSYHPIKSLQGKWEPNMFNTRNVAELEKTHAIPWAHLGEIEKVVIERSQRKKVDLANKLLHLKPFMSGYVDRELDVEGPQRLGI